MIWMEAVMYSEISRRTRLFVWTLVFRAPPCVWIHESICTPAVTAWIINECDKVNDGTTGFTGGKAAWGPAGSEGDEKVLPP